MHETEGRKKISEDKNNGARRRKQTGNDKDLFKETECADKIKRIRMRLQENDPSLTNVLQF